MVTYYTSHSSVVESISVFIEWWTNGGLTIKYFRMRTNKMLSIVLFIGICFSCVICFCSHVKYWHWMHILLSTKRLNVSLFTMRQHNKKRKRIKNLKKTVRVKHNEYLLSHIFIASSVYTIYRARSNEDYFFLLFFHIKFALNNNSRMKNLRKICLTASGFSNLIFKAKFSWE